MKLSRLRSTLIVGAVWAGGLSVLAACADSSLDLPTAGELSLTLEVTPNPISAGQQTTVAASSVGTSLLGTVIDYGDGFIDSIGAAGAQTQTVRCPKGYNEPGMFVIKVTIDDQFQGRLTREDTLQVDASGGSLPPNGPSGCENPGG